MRECDIKKILESYKEGRLCLEDALAELKTLPYEDLGFAKVDHHRALRTGEPEVIYCEGKEIEHVVEIVRSMDKKGSNVLGTRASRELYQRVAQEFPQAKYNEMGRLIRLENERVQMADGYVVVASGGTSDLSVAEEAAGTLEFLGNKVERLYDVGVAGLHRLLDQREVLEGANGIIAIAGMEGALATVITGLVKVPVIGVPTSVGYGANLGGIAALLSMINSCASGMSVVNIDNGFGAAFLASMINKRSR